MFADILPKNYMADLLPKNYMADLLPKNYMTDILPRGYMAGVLPKNYMSTVYADVLPKNFFKSITPTLDFSPFRNLIQITTPTNRILSEHLLALRVRPDAAVLNQTVAALRAATQGADVRDQPAVETQALAPGASDSTPTDLQTAQTVAEQLGVDTEGVGLGDSFYASLASAAEGVAEDVDPAAVLETIREQDPALAENIEHAAAVLQMRAEMREGLAIKATIGVFLALYWVLRLFVNSVPVIAATDDTAQAAKGISDKVEGWFDG